MAQAYVALESCTSALETSLAEQHRYQTAFRFDEAALSDAMSDFRALRVLRAVCEIIEDARHFLQCANDLRKWTQTPWVDFGLA
jgi:hypothetical protein